ncbi:MAG: hypothetical protein RQ826_15895 [Xanthomonadales bacterium]|nr:hypothetical protein [Xanthomonadales bacterium]
MKPEKRTPGGNRANASFSAETAHGNDNPADRLLARLDGVRQTGPDTWTAKSPCRDDRTPSLSIKQVGDRLLIHDFGGNTADEILQAVGLSLGDLFDRPLTNHGRPFSQFQRKRQNQALEALKALMHECRVAWVCAEQMHAGFNLDPADRERLNLAMSRIRSAEELCS